MNTWDLWSEHGWVLSNLGLLWIYLGCQYLSLGNLVHKILNNIFGVCRISHHLLNQTLSNQRVLLSYFLDYIE
jgi:hypothetical protein